MSINVSKTAASPKPHTTTGDCSQKLEAWGSFYN